MYKQPPHQPFRPAGDFDPFQSRMFMNQVVRDQYFPPHPYPPQDTSNLSQEEVELLSERGRLLDALGQIMLKKHDEGITDYEITTLAHFIHSAFLEHKRMEREKAKKHPPEPPDEAL